MEPATLAEFPNFRDGDVAVAFTATKVYRLHSSVLKRNSKYFAETLHAPGPKLNKQAREANAAAYRLEYRKHPEDETHPGFWIRLDVSERGRFESKSGLLLDISNGKLMDPKHRQWDWLFGIFYNKQPNFNDNTLGSLTTDCISLIEVAESVGSTNHVRGFIDLALLQQDKDLWSSIATSPGIWAELACRTQSQTIFKESICHLVGKWLMLSEEERADLSEDIHTLCVAKFRELDLAREAIEMRIVGYYPTFLCRDAKDKPGRPSYSSDIYMWMASSFFRQWFAQNISNGNNRKAKDGGYEFYKNLSLGGPAYLDHEDFRNFHQYFPMSSKACAVLERDMGSLKEGVKQFVQNLMESQVHLDLAQNPQVKWLTCTVVYKEDCPWMKRARAEREEAAANQKDMDDHMFFEDASSLDRSVGNESIENGCVRNGSTSPTVQDDSNLGMKLTGARTYNNSDADE